MKSQFSFNCILGLAIFFSQLVPGISIAAELRDSWPTFREVEEHASNIVENIRRTAIAISEVPFHKQTFENTLRPWNRLSAQLAKDFNKFDTLGKLNPHFSAIVSQISDDLHAYLLEIVQNPDLHQTLMICSLNTAHNVKLNPFQRYIGARFVKNSSNEPVYLYGSSEEQNNSATDFSILNLKSGSFEISEISDLADNILAENVDVVCIQEIAADDHAYELYEILQGNYAHFIYVPPKSALDLKASSCESGMLIASKYRMEQAQFNTFQGKASNVNEGFFDFILKNANASLGHIYTANLKRDGIDEAITYQVIQIMEKIQDDFLNKEESIPFVLCGDLKVLQGSQKSKKIMRMCFGLQDNNSDQSCALLLQYLPYLPKEISLRSEASMTSLTTLDDRFTSHVVKRSTPHSNTHCVNTALNSNQSSTVKKIEVFIEKGFTILPVKSKGSSDNDNAGGSWEARFDVRFGGEDGPQYDVSIKAEAHDDKGNYVEATANYNINSGEGNAGVGGGNKHEKDK